MAQPATKKVKTEDGKAVAKVKAEQGSAKKMSKVSKAIVTLLKENGEMTEEAMSEKLQIDRAEIRSELDMLVRKGVLGGGTDPYQFRVVDQKSQKLVNELGADEDKLYHIIHSQGPKGAWSKSLSKVSDFPVAKVNKIATTLIKMGLVKKVSVQGQVKKVFVAAEFEVHTDEKGRPWDGKDGETILKGLREAILRDLGMAPRTMKQLFQLTSSVFKFEMKEDDVEVLLKGLQYEGRIRKMPSRINIKLEEDKRDDGEDESEEVKEYVYMVRRGDVVPTSLEIPCSNCPVREVCREGTTRINPRSCVYLEAFAARKDTFPTAVIAGSKE